jgi:hypothetical protein
MAWRILLGPLWMAVLVGVWVAAVAYCRREAWSRRPLWPFALGGVMAFVAALAGARVGVGGWVSSALGVRALGVATLVGAALLAFLAARDRTRSSLLLAQAPLTLDEAIDRVRAGRPPPVGIFTGRIGASDPVASPGGIVCALYDAEVREASPSPGASPGANSRPRGPLLSVERAASSTIFLRGERCRARVAFSEGALWAQPQARRCRVDRRFSLADGALLAGGALPMEAVSYERVARLGEPCAVVGRLNRGMAEGTYVLKGPSGGPALLVLGGEASRPAKRLLARAWALFAASAALSVLGAWLISP